MSKDLETLRAQMDAVDKEILDAFRKRMELSAEIAEYKKANGLPVLDIGREKAKLDSIAKNVDDDLAAFVSKLYLTLADLSKEYQEKING
ncbi:MAG: chorismate mutase [Clostridiales bacterium]|nr:chorismate mutase [Candidatus Crickella caballi]